MIHRRDLSTDFEGPLVLDDTDHLENLQFYLLFDTISNSATLKKRLQYYQQFPPILFFGSTPSSVSWNFPATSSALTKDFPLNVHLLTLQLPSATSPSILLRLLNIYEKDDGSTLSQPVTINVTDHFQFASVTHFEERSLTAIWALKDMKRWKWETSTKVPENKEEEKKWEKTTTTNEQDFVVTLNPVEIKTFFIS